MTQKIIYGRKHLHVTTRYPNCNTTMTKVRRNMCVGVCIYKIMSNREFKEIKNEQETKAGKQQAQQLARRHSWDEREPELCRKTHSYR